MQDQNVSALLSRYTASTTLRDALATLLAGLREAWEDPHARRGTWGMTLVGVGSLTPAFLPPDAAIIDQLGLGWLGHGSGRVAATLVLIAGMALLVDAWLRLRPRPGSPPIHGTMWLLWSLPVVLAPPLFSRDAYSYAAQGRILADGLDPYAVGPAWVPGPFSAQVDPLWMYSPAPYGPLALQIQHTVVSFFGDNAYAAAVAMRMPALLAVGLLAVALPRLARRFGVRRDQAMWLGVLNPLVIMHFVGGAHGDALMVGLIACALLLASRGNLVLASVTVATAASIKQTAILALVGVVGMAIQADPQRIPKLRAFLRHSMQHGLIAAVTFTAITIVTGLGWGWLPNLIVPASLRSLLSPPTFVGSTIELLLRFVGAPDDWVAAALPLARTVGALIGIAAIVWIAWTRAARTPLLATAAAFLALCATSPVVHPWYILWGGVVLAAVRLSDKVITSLTWVTLFFVTYGIVDATVSNGTWALGVSAAAWMLAQLLSQRQRHAQEVRTPVPASRQAA